MRSDIFRTEQKEKDDNFLHITRICPPLEAIKSYPLMKRKNGLMQKYNITNSAFLSFYL